MTGDGQLLAVVLALAGSGCYAVAAVTQQGVAASLASGRAFDIAVLVRLARRPAWLAGLAAVIAGFALQAAALALGRLVVIEPLLATGLLFALALAARRDHRPLGRAEWAAAVAVVAGLAVFLAAGQPTGGQRTASVTVLGLAAAAAVGLAGPCAMLAGRFPAARRALLLGVAGGVTAGVTDAFVKSVTVLAAVHPLALVADARLYLLIVVGLLTYTVQQNGYRAAGLAAFLPAFAVIEPVIGSVLGLTIYHERLNNGPGQVVVELAACAAAAWGIARLAGSGIVSGPQAPPPDTRVTHGHRGARGHKRPLLLTAVAAHHTEREPSTRWPRCHLPTFPDLPLFPSPGCSVPGYPAICGCAASAAVARWRATAGARRASNTIPAVMTASDTTSAATSIGPRATFSFSQRYPMPIETSDVTVVITASAGEIRVPDWKAS